MHQAVFLVELFIRHCVLSPLGFSFVPCVFVPCPYAIVAPSFGWVGRQAAWNSAPAAGHSALWSAVHGHRGHTVRCRGHCQPPFQERGCTNGHRRVFKSNTKVMLRLNGPATSTEFPSPRNYHLHLHWQNQSSQWHCESSGWPVSWQPLTTFFAKFSHYFILQSESCEAKQRQYSFSKNKYNK